VLPTDSAHHPARRAVLGAALVLTVGTAMVTAGCDDASGEDGKGTGPAGSARPTPTVDPAVAAAVRTVTGHLGQLTTRYADVVRRHPALKAQLATASKHHAAHLARLNALAGVTAPPPGNTPSTTPMKAAPIATSPAGALADLAAREQALAVAHATAAAGLSGEPARVLASIAASETQIALSLAAAKAPATGATR